MSKSIKIDDATYELVTKFAKQEDRRLSNALSRLVKLGLERSISSASQALSTPATQATPVAQTRRGIVTPNFPNGIDWAKIEKEALSPEGLKAFEKQLAEAKKRAEERGPVVGELTEKDLATAKVTFEERPDFKEPEKWDSHAWPTV